MRIGEYHRSASSGCCGIEPGNILFKKTSGVNAIKNYSGEESIKNFLKLEEQDFKKIADTVIFTARRNGAVYSDIRVCKYRNQNILSKEEIISVINESENLGFGVRVLINGTWGFASSAFVNEGEAVKITLLACEIAKANSKLQKIPVELIPVKSYNEKYSTDIKVNPFDVSLTEKIDLQLKYNKIAKSYGADFVDSFMWFINEWKYFASSEGSYIVQDLYRIWSQTTPTFIDKSKGIYESRKTLAPPFSKGYEYFNEFDFEKEIETAAENAKMKLKAESVTPGKRDVIIHGNNLFLTIHESCGHPTELDRALGYEANYAGTSFMTPDKIGNLKYGSELINLTADRTQKYGLATRGFDDDGAKTVEFPIIKDGMFVNYQTTRELAKYIGNEETFACAYADSWSHFPIQRMPNISLEPGKEKKSLDDLISETDDAILVIGDGSWSIDMQRYNFQFTGQEFWEIKNGKKEKMLKDVAYQGNTVDFWNSCDAICDESEYYLGGSLFCGKGEPIQLSPVSHGAVPSRFRQVNILNTNSQI